MSSNREKPAKSPSWTHLRETKPGFLSQEKQPVIGKTTTMPKLPRPLDLEEKKYMLAVQKGDIPATKRILLRAKRTGHPKIDCRDPLGRTALNLAIDAEDLGMLELLVVMGVQTNDALLHAISVGFVEGVELLLEYEEIIHKSGEPYSWERVERNISSYTPDITPLILAAHKNNYEILKLLIDRGATIPMPHDIRCGCEGCVVSSTSDSLRHSIARINAYRALASPSLIALSSTDPILTAFEISWELKNLAYTEQEFKAEYMELRRQCMSFAQSLLNQTRSTQELAIILNYDPNIDVPYQDGDHMNLARLKLAIDYKQKKFVAHSHIQQLLASLWYDGLPGFRRKTPLMKTWEIVKIAILFPYYCFLYMIAPTSSTGRLMKKPFMKFLIHSSSYLFFLFLLILMSQRVEQILLDFFMGIKEDPGSGEKMTVQRGLGPTITETAVFIYVLGFIWEESKELWTEGLRSYMNDLWNVVDVSRNFLYMVTFALRIFAYVQQRKEIRENPALAYFPREMWHPYDPQLIAEGLCAAANVLSALKIVHMFSINPYLGPLQVSLGRMVIDIIKFILIYTLVLFAFACGLNQLLWYYADLEKQVCFSLPGGLPDWENNSSACMNWRRFANLFEATQSLFWATFGLWGLEAFQLKGIQNYTRFWAMLMFGCYSIINVVVLLNLLIAMMSHSFTVITEKSDTEWKFARTELWLKYFEPGSTLPPPFNLIPSPKSALKLLKGKPKRKSDNRSIRKKVKDCKERDYRHMAVMRALVWRYIIQQQRAGEEREVTEDDISEVKNDISSLRCDLLEVFRCSGFDVDNVLKKGMLNNAGCRKSRVWERRLLKDFHVSPIAGASDKNLGPVAGGAAEGPKEKFRRAARTVIGKQQAVHQRWALVVRQAQRMCHIGSTPRNALPHRQSLKKAMEEAARLANTLSESPLMERSNAASPMITSSVVEGRRLLAILRSPMAERGLTMSSEVNSPRPEINTAGHGDSNNKANALQGMLSSGPFLIVPPKTSGIFHPHLETGDSGDEDSGSRKSISVAKSQPNEHSTTKQSESNQQEPSHSSKLEGNSAYSGGPASERDENKEFKEKGQGSLSLKSVSLMNFESPSPPAVQRSPQESKPTDDMGTLATAVLLNDSQKKDEPLEAKEDTINSNDSTDQHEDNAIEPERADLYQPPPLPASKPPLPASPSLQNEENFSLREMAMKLSCSAAAEDMTATASSSRRESEMEPELAHPAMMSEDEEQPEPDMFDFDEATAACQRHGSQQTMDGYGNDVHQLPSPAGGLRNLRKPSTTSLEQVIVRQDTKEDLRLDMASGASMNEDASPNRKIEASQNMAEAGQEAEAGQDVTESESRAKRGHQVEPQSPSTVISCMASQKSGSKHPGVNLGRLAHQDVDNRGSTEGLILSSHAVQKSRDEEGHFAEGRAAAFSGFRTEWQDVEHRPRDKPNKKSHCINRRGRGGWL